MPVCYPTYTNTVCMYTSTYILYVTKPARIIHVSAKIADFLSLLYYNLITIYTNQIKCLLLVQNLIGFLLQLTETGYHNHN